MKLVFDEDSIKYFRDNGYEPTMGARPLKRLFETKVKIPLSKKILFDDLKNVTIDVCITDEELCFDNIRQEQLH